MPQTSIASQSGNHQSIITKHRDYSNGSSCSRHRLDVAASGGVHAADDNGNPPVAAAAADAGDHGAHDKRAAAAAAAAGFDVQEK